MEIQKIREEFRKKSRESFKLLKNTSGGGPDVRGIVLQRRPSKSTHKKAPTPLKVLLTTPDVDVVLKGQDDKHKVCQYSVVYVSCFNLPETIQQGAYVALGGFGASTYKEHINFSSNKVIGIEDDNILSSIPPSTFILKEIEDVKDTSVILPIGCESDNLSSFSLRDDTPSTYIYENKDTGEEKIALWSCNGFPITFVQHYYDVTQNIIVVLRMYENHLRNLGISSCDTWKKIAPHLIENLKGNLIGYIHKDATESLDINKFGDNSDENRIDFALTVVAQRIDWDLEHIITNSGFEVSLEFVQQQFTDPFIQSDLSSSNPLSMNKQSRVVNLHEFTGKLNRFFDNKNTRYFLLSNFDDSEKEDVEELKNMNITDRENCFNKTPGSKLRVRYNGEKCWQIFAIEPLTGRKRKL